VFALGLPRAASRKHDKEIGALNFRRSSTGREHSSWTFHLRKAVSVCIADLARAGSTREMRGKPSRHAGAKGAAGTEAKSNRRGDNHGADNAILEQPVNPESLELD
jgi:hypothetical protein